MTYTFFDPDDDSSAPRDDDVSAISGNLNGGTTSLWAQDLQRLSPMSDSLDVLKDEHKDVRIVNDSILRISGLLLTVTLGAIYFSLIPNRIVSHYQTLSIGRKNFGKWTEYERPIDDVISCCNAMKNESNEV